MAEIPIIDVSGMVTGERGALARVARDVAGPSAEWGAFQIVGHGIPSEELRAFELQMRRFFELPRAEKLAVRRTRDNARGFYDEELTKNRPDWKEVFDYGADRQPGEPPTRHSDGTNQWPDLPGFRTAMERHFRSVERVGLALLRALCLSLGLQPESLDAAFRDHSSFVRLNRYGPCPDPAPPDAPLFPEKGHLGVYHHTDAGALTLLSQDDVAGLQFWHEGQFVLTEPIDGALAVNLGDMLQVWSNDRYQSALHRVLANAERERLSAPFFLNPSYDTVCAPLEGLLARGEDAHYRPVSWSHFRDQRSAGDYADYGHEIQIADFRL